VRHNYNHVTYFGKYFLTKSFSQEKIEVEVKTNLDKAKAFPDTIYFGPPSHNGMKFKYKPHSKANLKKMKWCYCCSAFRGCKCKATLYIKVRKRRVYFKMCGKHSSQYVDENGVTAMLNEELCADGVAGMSLNEQFKQRAIHLALHRLELSGLRIFEFLRNEMVPEGRTAAVTIPTSGDVSKYFLCWYISEPSTKASNQFFLKIQNLVKNRSCEAYGVDVTVAIAFKYGAKRLKKHLCALMLLGAMTKAHKE
jgi:hypothetical protein